MRIVKRRGSTLGFAARGLLPRADYSVVARLSDVAMRGEDKDYGIVVEIHRVDPSDDSDNVLYDVILKASKTVTATWPARASRDPVDLTGCLRFTVNGSDVVDTLPDFPLVIRVLP